MWIRIHWYGSSKLSLCGRECNGKDDKVVDKKTRSNVMKFRVSLTGSRLTFIAT